MILVVSSSVTSLIEQRHLSVDIANGSRDRLLGQKLRERPFA